MYPQCPLPTSRSGQGRLGTGPAARAPAPCGPPAPTPAWAHRVLAEWGGHSCGQVCRADRRLQEPRPGRPASGPRPLGTARSLGPCTVVPAGHRSLCGPCPLRALGFQSAAVSRQGAHAALGLSLRAPSAPQDPGRPELALTQPGAGGRGAWHPRGPCGHRSAPRPGSGHSRRGRAAPGRSLGTRELSPPPSLCCPAPQVPVLAPGGLCGVRGRGPRPHGPAR